MTTVITMGLALLVLTVLYGLLLWVKTPWYRVDAQKMLRVLEMVLTGQATANDWTMAFGMTIRHDPELERLRQQCCLIEEKYFTERGGDYLFTREGLSALSPIREQLKALVDHDLRNQQ